MKKVFSILFFCCVLILLTFALFYDFEQEVAGRLESTSSVISFAVLSFLALLSDILLPIPSSLVMILNGKVLGPLWGTLLSLVAGLASSSIGFYLGRSSNKVFNRFFNEQEAEAGNRFFHRFGSVSIALSKALPVLAEAVALLAGTTAVPFRTFLAFSLVGQAVVALAYAWLGSMADAYDSNLVSGAIILSTLFIAWGIQATLIKRRQASA